jgi:hypothetical protein
MIAFEPLARFADEQLEEALDFALHDDEPKLVEAIVAEIQRRGHALEV